MNDALELLDIFDNTLLLYVFRIECHVFKNNTELGDVWKSQQ